MCRCRCRWRVSGSVRLSFPCPSWVSLRPARPSTSRRGEYHIYACVYHKSRHRCAVRRCGGHHGLRRLVGRALAHYALEPTHATLKIAAFVRPRPLGRPHTTPAGHRPRGLRALQWQPFLGSLQSPSSLWSRMTSPIRRSTRYELADVMARHQIKLID